MCKGEWCSKIAFLCRWPNPPLFVGPNFSWIVLYTLFEHTAYVDIWPCCIGVLLSLDFYWAIAPNPALLHPPYHPPTVPQPTPPSLWSLSVKPKWVPFHCGSYIQTVFWVKHGWGFSHNMKYAPENHNHYEPSHHCVPVPPVFWNTRWADTGSL